MRVENTEKWKGVVRLNVIWDDKTIFRSLKNDWKLKSKIQPEVPWSMGRGDCKKLGVLLQGRYRMLF